MKQYQCRPITIHNGAQIGTVNQRRYLLAISLNHNLRLRCNICCMPKLLGNCRSSETGPWAVKKLGFWLHGVSIYQNRFISDFKWYGSVFLSFSGHVHTWRCYILLYPVLSKVSVGFSPCLPCFSGQHVQLQRSPVCWTFCRAGSGVALGFVAPVRWPNLTHDYHNALYIYMITHVKYVWICSVYIVIYIYTYMAM